MARYIKSIGIDFGSSNTVVSAIVEGEMRPVVFKNPKTASECFESVMSVADGERKYFQSAMTDVSGKRYDTLKEKILDCNGAENAEHYLRALFSAITDSEQFKRRGYDLSRLNEVVFGYPAYYEPHAVKAYCDILTGIISGIFGKRQLKINCYPEPMLAATAYSFANGSDSAYKHVLADGSRMLILDFGGHTLDLSVARFVKNGNSVIPMTECDSGSISQFVRMGKSLTKDICASAYDTDHPKFDFELEQAKCKLFKDGEGYREASVEGLLKYKADSGASRFKMIYGKTLGPAVENGCVRIGLCNPDIGIERQYESFVSCICGYLSNNKVEEHSLNCVLFTGGASKIVPMREAVISGISQYLVRGAAVKTVDECGSAVAEYYDGGSVILSSSNAVALGAALACGRTSEKTKTEKSGRRAKQVSTEDYRFLGEQLAEIYNYLNNNVDKNSPVYENIFKILNRKR